MNEKEFWWVAINGPSAALCGFPARPSEILCSPRPGQLIGFPTMREAREAQKFMLEAPVAEVIRVMQECWVLRLRAGEMYVINVPNPEPSTTGPTCWAILR